MGSIPKSDIRRFYRSAAWRDQKGAALYRYGRICNRCGKIKGRFEVDHRTPVRISWANRLDMFNLQVLCVKCHGDKKREENAKWR